MLTEADDRTLREIDRLVLSWTLFRKEQPAISKAEKRMQEKKNAKGK
jgi:cytochrome c oxidase assembly protein Cox11